jgi:hypothetical protein
MHCIICHNNLILNLNPKTQARKWLIIYNTINGIISLKKHVNPNHFNVLNFFEEEVNCTLKEEEKQPSKRIPNIPFKSICSFFVCKKTFQERRCVTKVNFGRL